MSPTPDGTRLREQVGSTLRTAAGSVSFPPPGFDPDREPLVVLPVEAGAGRPRPRSGVGRLPVAAVVLAVVAVAVAALVARRDGSGEPSVESGVTPAAGLPDGVRAPSWVPDGLSPISVGWTTAGEAENANAGHYQLFEAPTGPGRLVVWAAQMAIGPSPTPGVTVRGQPAQLGTNDDWATALWVESGVSMTFWAEGMTEADAREFVGGLVPRPGGLREGFAPPAGGPLELVDEGEEPATIPARLRSTLVYSGRGAGERLVLEAESPLDPPAPYLAAVMEMNRSDRGSEHPVGPGAGAFLQAPDRSFVRLDVVGSWSLSGADVIRISESYRAVTPGELAGLIDEADAAAGALPLVATAELPAATVEVRGGDRFHVMCLRLPAGGERRCAGLDRYSSLGDVEGLGPGAVAGLVIGEDWYVVAATPDEDEDLGLRAGSSRHPFEPATVVADGWTIVLALVPEGIDEVGRTGWPDSLHRPPVVDVVDPGR